MSKLRVGIVGSGFGATAHAPAFALHPRFEVVAIASPASAQRVARERKIPHAFESAEAMLAGVELDVVSVASPPFDHHRSVLAALHAGKHVLCEKPFALTLAQAEEMTAAGARAGTACALAFEFRYVPAIIAIKELIDNGHLGALRELEVARLSRELLERNTQRTRDWWFSSDAGGGVASSVMPHLFDLANHLAGRALRSARRACCASPIPTATMLPGRSRAPSRTAPSRWSTTAPGWWRASATTRRRWWSRRPLRCTASGAARSPTGPSSATCASSRSPRTSRTKLEIATSPYDKHAAVHGNVPFLLSLIDALAQRIDLGTPGVPTFADGLVVQRSLDAIGYGRSATAG